ncbi:MAG: GNAT family N-acetyltransferase [Pyrinomonadaceae bacterium]
MNVRPLTTPEEFQGYVDFPQEVYRENSHWVPPDAHHLAKVLAGQAGFGSDLQIQPFWVEEGDRVLATVAAATSEVYNRHWNERMGHLFFFEALPDQNEAVQSLLSAACDWLKTRGCEAARLSFLGGMQMPLTIDAYHEVPTIIHGFNPAYYHSYIKNGGFVTEKGVVQYQIQFTSELAERYREMVEHATSSGISLRSCDFERLEQENEALTNIFNETFSAHWGFMPIPAQVMRGFTVELKDLTVADFIVFAETDGQTAGAVYSLPDLNQALHPMRGRNIEENFAEFQQHLAKVDHGVLLIIGVKKEYRGRGVNLALAAKSYLAMIERGYKTASYTVVMDDNWPSRKTAEKLGGRVTRNFDIYRREFKR